MFSWLSVCVAISFSVLTFPVLICHMSSDLSVLVVYMLWFYENESFMLTATPLLNCLFFFHLLVQNS